MSIPETKPLSGTSAGREALQNRLHATLVVFCAWLILTSPWVSMLRRIPAGADFFDYAHVVVGLLGLVVAVIYAHACLRQGRWRSHFPWVAGEVRPLAHDLAGLVHGRLPAAEGGGLFAVIEGLLLATLLLVAVTGAAWLVAGGSDVALDWRFAHVVGARVLIGLFVAHVLAVATHLLELA